MATFDVYDLSKNKVGSIELSDEVFAAEVKTQLVWEVINMQRANRRAGTHHTKTRGEVSGGGKKPYKQKGTGRARRGSSRSPLMVGGGVIFGPKPRKYTQYTTKRVRAGALISAVSVRAKDAQILILKNFDLAAIKTKALAETLKKLGAENALIVEGANERLELSARNIPKVKVIRPEGLNVYDVMLHEKLLVTEAAAKAIETRLLLTKNRRPLPRAEDAAAK